MEPTGPNHWSLDGEFLTQRGAWTVYVVVRRPEEYAETEFGIAVT